MMDIVGCAICHESFDEKQPSVITQCGHVFDENCLSEWLRNHPHCPTCRRPTGMHCLAKVHFSVVPVFKNEYKNCSDDLQMQLEAEEMKHAISLSAVEQLRKDLEAVEIEKSTLLDDAQTNVQQLSLLRKELLLKNTELAIAQSVACKDTEKKVLGDKNSNGAVGEILRVAPTDNIENVNTTK